MMTGVSSNFSSFTLYRKPKAITDSMSNEKNLNTNMNALLSLPKSGLDDTVFAIIKFREFKMFADLIEAGLDPNLEILITRKEALGEAFLNKEIPLLFLAGMFGFWKAVNLLVQNGVDINCSIKIGHTDLPMASAFIQHDQMDLLKRFIQLGLTQTHKDLLLNMAVEKDKLSMAKELRKAGGGLEYVFTLDDGAAGYTPLFLAIIKDNYQMAKWLLSEGANPNVADNEGMSAFHCVVHSRDYDLKWVKLFIEPRLVDINQYSADGITALHMASSFEIANYLVEQGADFELKSDHGEGYTPEEWVLHWLEEKDTGPDVVARHLEPLKELLENARIKKEVAEARKAMASTTHPITFMKRKPLS